MRTSPGLPPRRAVTGRPVPAAFSAPAGSASADAPGRNPDALGPGGEIRDGGDQLAFQIVSQRDAARTGSLFAAVDAKQ
ncbi:hypothetical protein [Streptomyces sp. NPDC058751]|uniref:hypothetical protein n=1 Tax=Streptomyces sp. NPDC058751 TaxID=3346623 RepID=UPI00369E554A